MNTFIIFEKDKPVQFFIEDEAYEGVKHIGKYVTCISVW